MTATAATTAMQTAREFIRAVQAKDIDAVTATLREDAEQLFMHTRAVTKPGGADAIIAGRRGGFCAADVRGRDEVLAYTRGIMDKFEPLVWRDHQWTPTPNPDEVFFFATGDMVVARTGQPYRIPTSYGSTSSKARSCAWPSSATPCSMHAWASVPTLPSSGRSSARSAGCSHRADRRDRATSGHWAPG